MADRHEALGGLTPLVITARDVRCHNCELLEAENAMLKRRLAERVTESVTDNNEGVTVTPSGVTESVTIIPESVTVTSSSGNTVTINRRGRPNSGNALTPAQKQKAYRERRDHQDLGR